MKKNKIIVHAITRMYLGGAQKICFDILKYLKDNNENVLLITGKKEELFYEIEKNQIDYYIIPELDRKINPLKDIIAIVKIFFLLKKLNKNYDNIYLHTHTSKAGFIVRIAGGLNNIRNIFHTAHGWAFYKGQNKLLHSIYILLEKTATIFTKKIIAVSKYVRDIGIESRIGNKNSYKIIYNGIKNPIYISNTNEIKKKLNIEYNKKIVLQVSCLKNQKSPFTFLQIANRFKYNENMFFILAGDGNLRKKLEKYIKQNNLNNVLLTGWYKKNYELYSIADICILTSIFEGLPLTILEAISYKLPVIATDIPPNSEILNEQFLCNIKDIDCFKNKIKNFINIDNINYKYYFSYNEMLINYYNLYK